MTRRALLLLLIVLVISACSKPASETTPTATVAAGVVAPSAATPLAVPAKTPTAGASPTPFTSFSVQPSVDTLKVRVNPGYLFDAAMLANKGDRLTVLGKAPGGEWLSIQTANGTKGWVFGLLVKSDIDIQRVPVIQPTDVQLIKGRVLDGNGTPIQGVGFEIKQGAGADAPTNVVMTDAEGEFYAYMPSNASGEWAISQTAISCLSNVWVDGSCSTYKTGYSGKVEPNTLNINLPQDGALTFLWH